jgi:hypothetical protein
MAMGVAAKTALVSLLGLLVAARGDDRSSWTNALDALNCSSTS